MAEKIECCLCSAGLNSPADLENKKSWPIYEKSNYNGFGGYSGYRPSGEAFDPEKHYHEHANPRASCFENVFLCKSCENGIKRDYSKKMINAFGSAFKKYAKLSYGKNSAALAA